MDIWLCHFAGGGFENGCSTYLKNEKELLNDITKILAGKAGVSLIYGVMDVNASGDIPVSYTHLGDAMKHTGSGTSAASTSAGCKRG